MSIKWNIGNSSQHRPGLEKVLPGLSLSGSTSPIPINTNKSWFNSFSQRLTPPKTSQHIPLLSPQGSPLGSLQDSQQDTTRLPTPPESPATSAAPVSRHTRQPPKSKFALWVGNLPPKPTLSELCELFGTPHLLSVYLIHRTGCAFVNYSSAEAMDEAVELYQQRGAKIRDHKLVIKTQERASSQTPAPVEQEQVDYSGDRYFICKSLTADDLKNAKATGKWSTQAHNREKFNRAFRNSKNVYFVFSANRTSSFYGYARMSSLIPDHDLVVDEVPHQDKAQVISVPAYSCNGVEYPAGNIVEDSTRGCLFWEAAGQEVVGEPEVGQWTAPCDIEWLSGDDQVMFSRTRQIKNSLNASKPVKVARDGTEIDSQAGKVLLSLF